MASGELRVESYEGSFSEQERVEHPSSAKSRVEAASSDVPVFFLFTLKETYSEAGLMTFAEVEVFPS